MSLLVSFLPLQKISWVDDLVVAEILSFLPVFSVSAASSSGLQQSALWLG